MSAKTLSATAGDEQRRSSIILVKERNDTNLDDPYETTFQQAGYSVSFLPALEFVFINQQPLLDHLTQPDTYSALVATSPRGAAAALTALTPLASTSPTTLSAWQHKPFYVVGDGSAAVIARSTLSLSVRAIGGNAERLATAIVADNTAQPTQPTRRLLVLSGNLRRQELFNVLSASSVAYEELTVYETRTNSRLQQQWQQLADTTDASSGWVCYFSPSGVSGVRQCVEAAVSEGEVGEVRRVRWLALRVAVLGQTSASAVRQAGWTVQAVAESPSPTQLLAAIQATEQQEQRQQESADTDSKAMSPLSTG